jgi:hypothetical protein
MLMDRLVMPAETWLRLQHHLDAAAPREDGAFLLLTVSRSSHGARLLASEYIAPPAWAWESNGEDHLRPSGRWLSEVLGRALWEGRGLAFVHSHPLEAHPPGLSYIDLETSRAWAASFSKSLPTAFASLVVSTGVVSGVWFDLKKPGLPREFRSIQALGMGRIDTVSSLQGSGAEIDDRQERAISSKGNAWLRALRVVVVGAGGTGSSVVELLARSGVHQIAVIDPDSLDSSSNLRRVAGSQASDLKDRTLKVAIAKRHVASLGLGTELIPIAADVRTREAADSLVSADLIINTTDTHSSRSFVNQVAYQHWVATIDVGVRIGVTGEMRVSGMPAEIRLLLPDNGCLWCRSVLDSGRIREENLPRNERAALAKEGYVQGAGDEREPSLGSLTGAAAAFAVLMMIKAGVGGGAPDWAIFDPWEIYGIVGTSPVRPDCICTSWRGRGDEIPISYLPSKAERGKPLLNG